MPQPTPGTTRCVRFRRRHSAATSAGVVNARGDGGAPGAHSGGCAVARRLWTSSGRGTPSASKTCPTWYPFSVSRAQHYKRQGTASYRSGSPRFGSPAELAMAGALPTSNYALGAKEPLRPGIGTYSGAGVYRDHRGSYWASSHRTSSVYFLPSTPRAAWVS